MNRIYIVKPPCYLYGLFRDYIYAKDLPICYPYYPTASVPWLHLQAMVQGQYPRAHAIVRSCGFVARSRYCLVSRAWL